MVLLPENDEIRKQRVYRGLIDGLIDAEHLANESREERDIAVAAMMGAAFLARLRRARGIPDPDMDRYAAGAQKYLDTRDENEKWGRPLPLRPGNKDGLLRAPRIKKLAEYAREALIIVANTAAANREERAAFVAGRLIGQVFELGLALKSRYVEAPVIENEIAKRLLDRRPDHEVAAWALVGAGYDRVTAHNRMKRV